ncbi:hypothetical protein Taro_054604 [Colocasia esculenta]|uniref:non-specific serine/threonine protein kinase n=1 Tax=Colocasia esculenta TaxID=4460 RepID=A0A843XR02_COLES|nr:hypothetical protein [Colocasia esculenta]
MLPEEFRDLTSLAQMLSVPLCDLSILCFVVGLHVESNSDLTRNYINGSIPAAAWASLPLKSMVLENNMLQGRLPRSLGNLKNLTRLLLSANNFTGELPETLGQLKNLTDFRIDGNDISGMIPSFLGNWTKLQRLVLRNCSICGQIPEYIRSMRNLKTLYLTNNKLNGSIFPWIQRSHNNFDLSYNTFTDMASAPAGCSRGNLNFVSSFSSIQNNLKWAYSSTGDFVGADKQEYIAANASILMMPNPELYMSARSNPLSLKYYGLCLQSGSYTVKLNFAEIIFTDDQTFRSNGRRVFDVSIQDKFIFLFILHYKLLVPLPASVIDAHGKKVLEDFNIAQAANGTHKEIVKTFTTLVGHSTLEIHFQWGGKGTNAIPDRGFYGPLISAISVTPNFEPELDENKLPIGAIVGIGVASCVLAILILILLWFYLRRRNNENNELRGLELQTGYFSLKQIKAATRNFDPSNKIGEGGFGSVYKGVLPDGSTIAVKQLSSKSKQGNREFVNEIGMISALQHPNLVKLFGCCIEGNQLLLIYEYMENNSLARALFGLESSKLKLNWQTRHNICLGIARGLAYLHEESRLKIVHRDIKATNILLDRDLNAKISDFGLAKLDEEENTHISTRIAGTMGYMAPEYAMRGYLTDKADVYSFGVVTLEIVSGKSNTNYRPKEDLFYLLDRVHKSFM